MNDVNKTGGELIQEVRDRQVMVHNHTIDSDATKYRSGELVNVALALIHKQASYAPADWPKETIEAWVNLPDVDRLILAGAFIAAQVDVLNYYTAMAELMQKYAANVPAPKIFIPESEN